MYLHQFIKIIYGVEIKYNKDITKRIMIIINSWQKVGNYQRILRVLVKLIMNHLFILSKKIPKY